MMFFKVPRTWLPASIIALWCFYAVFGSMLSLEPNHIELDRILVSPGEGTAWLGFDDLGRPVWDRLLAGAGTSFFVAFWVVGLSVIIGTFIGVVSAYLGGVWDTIIVRIIDIFLAFPGILLAIALAGILGPGVSNIVIALSVVGWVGYARLSRAQVLSLKNRDHVQAAIALGSSSRYIMMKHLVPLIAAPLIVEATFGIAAVVIGEAGLSYLGLGVQPPAASWGTMIRDGADYLLVAPHMVLAPSIALLLVILAINLLGDSLRDYLDVKSDG